MTTDFFYVQVEKEAIIFNYNPSMFFDYCSTCYCLAKSNISIVFISNLIALQLWYTIL